MASIPVARTADLQRGEMRVIEVSDQKILLLQTSEGDWRALSPTCPHAGAPLVEGALCGPHLICPWHKSCFAVSDGTLLEPPSLQSLSSYSLEIVGDVIRVDLESSTQNKRAPYYSERAKSSQTFVILGGGAAGAAAVRELRALGFAGRLVMIGQEQRKPYDRTLLSKMYLSGQADSKQLPLRPETLLTDCEVEFLVAEVELVDPGLRIISFNGGEPSLRYDELLVATGGKPKLIPLSEAEEQPFVLRNVEDANRLIKAAGQAQNAVLIGASFISMEVASALRERGLNVTIVSSGKIPLLKQLGPRMGQLLLEKHREKGVRFLPESKLLAVKGRGAGSTVQLSSGLELPADLVVSGIGIEPATAFLKNVALREDQSLSVDGHMRVLGVEHMFAAGDVANFPQFDSGRRTRIEHWRVAQEQAKVAAANMMGLEQLYQGIPYFWTYHYGIRYEFFGNLPHESELLIDGDLNDSKFVAAYLHEDRCQAIFSANRESETARLFDRMQLVGALSMTEYQNILHPKP